jgi:thiol-disulfide isomerase/thioredoxin
MKCQDLLRPIVEQLTPVSDKRIIDIQQQISDPFISEYIRIKNNDVRKTIEANKLLKGAVVNEVPKTEADKVFDAIISKYKGKVVYVDFWATWCAPCRSGIERIKPLKDEMSNGNVVFVYITNPTSPQATYDNMIPGIKGEHYRVSNDEWNYLKTKFQISGIPHYALVGKDGQMINPHLSHMENASLKALLVKHMNE